MRIGKYVYVKDNRVKRLKFLAAAFISLIIFGGLLIFNSLTSDNPSQTGQNNQTTVLPGENDSRAVPVDKSMRDMAELIPGQAAMAWWKKMLILI